MSVIVVVSVYVYGVGNWLTRSLVDENQRGQVDGVPAIEQEPLKDAHSRQETAAAREQSQEPLRREGARVHAVSLLRGVGSK